MEVGQKQKGGLNIQLHGMVVEIALGLVHLPQDALAITDAHQNPERVQDARTHDGNLNFTRNFLFIQKTVKEIL